MRKHLFVLLFHIFFLPFLEALKEDRAYSWHALALSDFIVFNSEFGCENLNFVDIWEQMMLFCTLRCYYVAFVNLIHENYLIV